MGPFFFHGVLRLNRSKGRKTPGARPINAGRGRAKIFLPAGRWWSDSCSRLWPFLVACLSSEKKRHEKNKTRATDPCENSCLTRASSRIGVGI